MKYDAIVIGVSAGGLVALVKLLQQLPPYFPIPVIIVQHRSKEERTLLEEVMQSKCSVRIKQADEKEKIKSGVVYFAPADYHLLIESDRSFSLTYDERVNYSRPSIDVLFETAAAVYKNRLLGIILTGANKDGTEGIKMIGRHGGATVAQEPRTAAFPEMPQAAIDTGYVQYVMNLDEIRDLIISQNSLHYG